MNPNICSFIRLLWLSLYCALIPATQAASIMVDTFDQGGFSVGFPPVDDNRETVNLPLADHRVVRYRPLGLNSIGLTHLSRSLDPVAGQLKFAVINTTPNPPFPVSMDLIYGSTSTIHDITGYTEFILAFSELSGVGTLYVELSGSQGLEAFRVDLTGPGEVRYPVSRVLPHPPGQILDAFTALNFTFEARSPEFSFTLDEIRLIPEPSAALLALAAGVGLLARRRRRGS